MASPLATNNSGRERETLLAPDDTPAITISQPAPLALRAHKSDHNLSHTNNVCLNVSCSAPWEEKSWSTIWLCKRTLVTFMALFAAMTASLVVLRVVDRSRNGFRLTLGTNHYAWTYGPTALLTIVLALWRQVDYHCKILQPWQELRWGPRTGDRTVLLDYVGPLSITSLIVALRHRHYAVASSICGFFLLKTVILLSTGLLVLRPSLTVGSFSTTISSSFAPGKLWDSAHWFPSDSSGYETGDSYYMNVSALPVHAYLAILNDDPEGRTQSKRSTAYQMFEIPPVNGLEDLTLEVDVFHPQIACEIAEPSFLNNRSVTAFAFRGSTCSTDLPRSIEDPRDPDGTLHHPDGPLYDFVSCEDSSDAGCEQPSMGYCSWKVNCSNPSSPAMGSFEKLNADTQYDARYALLVANHTRGYWTNNENDDPQSVFHFYETAAVLCRIDYSITRANVTQYTNNDEIKIGGIGEDRRLQNLTGIMLGDLMVASLSDASMELSTSDPNLKFGDGLFYLLLRTSKAAGSMERLLDETTLRDSAVQVFGGIAQQFMRSAYLQASDASAKGSGHLLEDRLHVVVASLWATMAGCAALLIISLSLLRTRPVHHRMAHDPSNVSALAVVLAASSRANRFLSNHKDLHRTSQLTMLLRPYEFCSMSKSRLNIAVAQSESAAVSKSDAKNKKFKSQDTWTPLSARLYMAWLTLLAPLVVIAIIETLYQISQRYTGIANVSESEDITAALSRFLPALATFIIATLINSLDFTIASFAPFSLLREGAVGVAKGLSFRILGELPPLALWRAAMAGHFPTLFSSLAGIIGSVLAIAASGLLVINSDVVAEDSINAILSHSWDVNWHDSAITGDGGAGVRLNQIQHGSREMPVMIWNNIVIPEVASISDPMRSSTRSRRNRTLEIIALHPELSCELIDEDNVYPGKVDYYGEAFPYTVIYARPPLNPPCRRVGSNGTKDHYEFIAGMADHKNAGKPVFAVFNDLHLGPWDRSLFALQYSEDIPNLRLGRIYDNSVLPDNPAGCPSIGIGVSGQSSSNHFDDRFTAFLCSQKIAQMRLKVAYSSNGDGELELNTDIAPVMLDSPAGYLNNGIAGIDSFPYRPETYLAQNLTNFGYPDSVTIDKVFKHVIYGPNGSSIEKLVGKANRENLLGAAQQLYGRYMSLVIDAKFRQPFPASTPQEDKIVNGTATYFTSRLQVDYGSKLALQILLGIMTLFATLAFGLSDLRGTLPRKPTSIASVMALLAGSDLVKDERLRPENLRGRTLDEVLDGEVFSLGWWPGRDKDGQKGEGLSDEESKSREGSDESAGETSKRFGIDIGIPEQLGLRETRGWRLRQRLTNIARRAK